MTNSQNETDISVTKTIRELEQQWALAIQRRDSSRMNEFLADNYILAIGIEGRPLFIIAREQWLETLPVYYSESMTIEEMRVGVYGAVAAVTMLYIQKARTAGERDISGHFLLTDIWIKTSNGCCVTERHSNRAEKLPAKT